MICLAVKNMKSLSCFINKEPMPIFAKIMVPPTTFWSTQNTRTSEMDQTKDATNTQSCL